MNKKLTPRARFFILLLIVGLHFSAHYMMSSAHFDKTADSHSIDLPSRSPEGAYKLIEGTYGCPQKLSWTASKVATCRGFNLDILKTGSAKKSEQFCYGENKSKAASLVTRNENVIQKKSWLSVKNLMGPHTVAQEDTLILDDAGKLLWEHSLDGQGHSCLYSRLSI